MKHLKPMNKQKFIQAVGSRSALNIYLWLALIIIKFPDADDQPEHAKPLFYALIVFNMCFFFVLSYCNNFYLQPKFLFKHKKVQYFTYSFLLLFITSYLFVVNLKFLQFKFPYFDTLQTSMVMSPLNKGFGFWEVLEDISTYFFVMLLWSLVFGLLGVYHYSKNKLVTLQNILNQHREAELVFLKNQINPHFLFNTLNNIYALTLKQHHQAPDIILKLAAVLRYMLYESEGNLVSAEAEKEIMLSYIDIELLRIAETNNMHFTIHIDDDYKIAPLLWLPVLENVFKYTRNVASPNINFDFSIRKGILTIKCSNNFVKTVKIGEENIGGIGLTNLQKRLALLYPNKFTMMRNEVLDIFELEITIELTS